MEKTQSYRLLSASILKDKVDEIRASSPAAKIVIMGDFNDTPMDKSLTWQLGAKNNPKRTLYNLMYNKARYRKIGTYSFKGQWDMLDQFIVSSSLLNATSGLGVGKDDAYVFQRNWML